MLDLSIIIPTYNRAIHLEKLLVSLWTGVGCEYEVIAVDGASDDETPDVLLDAFCEHLGKIGLTPCGSSGRIGVRGSSARRTRDFARRAGGTSPGATMMRARWRGRWTRLSRRWIARMAASGCSRCFTAAARRRASRMRRFGGVNHTS